MKLLRTQYSHRKKWYSQTTSKLKCVGSPCRIIYTVFGKPPVSLLKLFDYNAKSNLGCLKIYLFTLLARLRLFVPYIFRCGLYTKFRTLHRFQKTAPVRHLRLRKFWLARAWYWKIPA